MSELIQLTGLWLNTKQDGEKYFSGNLGGAKVLIFKNKHKEKDKVEPRDMLVVSRYLFQADDIRIHVEDVDAPAIVFEQNPGFAFSGCKGLRLGCDIGAVEFHVRRPSPTGVFIAKYLDLAALRLCIDKANIPDFKPLSLGIAG